MPNKLIHQTSPYLLQHAHNPVDWYPWGDEALERAQTHRLPILVSIGYSACHWCHVMERESFENEAVAAYMNANFVNIKVDREERPDIDQIYMDAVTALTGHGGWPLNCFLLPDAKPFYGGTYFPPQPAHNRPDWLSVLRAVKNAFDNNRTAIEQQANQLTYAIVEQDNRFFKLDVYPQSSPTFETYQLQQVVERLTTLFDRDNGGFGRGQKFPQTLSLRFLLAYYHYTKVDLARDHVIFSVDKMIKGGLYDHLGGGFARYTVDMEWKVPHFEKMLYDNALLVCTLVDVYQLTKEERYRRVIMQTLDWVERDMTCSRGGFYSAYDADSEGIEGKFYTWSKAEITALLQDDALVFALFYGISEEGNWDGTNILQQQFEYSDFAQKIGYDVAELEALIARCCKQLFKARENRIKPLLDDKIILGWNALQVSAYCCAYQALGEPKYVEIAEQTMQFLLGAFADTTYRDSMIVADEKELLLGFVGVDDIGASLGLDSGRLYHTYKDGVAKYPAFLDDYAFLIDALLNLYQITFKELYLQQARGYVQHVLRYFREADGILFYYTPSYQHDILLRKRDCYDGATPSGNAMMANCLHRLGLLFDEAAYSRQASEMVALVVDSIDKYPSSFSLWAKTFLQLVYPSVEVAVVGREYKSFACDILKQYHPNRVLMASATENGYPLLKNKGVLEDTLIYICRNYACQKPHNNPVDALMALVN